MADYIDGQKCPICGTGKLKSIVTEETYRYKKAILVIPDQNIFRCNNCNEELAGEIEM